MSRQEEKLSGLVLRQKVRELRRGRRKNKLGVYLLHLLLLGNAIVSFALGNWIAGAAIALLWLALLLSF